MRALFLLLLAGCNQAALPANSDGGGADLRSSGFCSGQARIELNGMRADSPAVIAHPLILNCCDAAEIDYLSMQISQPIVFSWRHQAGQPLVPVTLDLANLPAEWSVSVMSGCTTAQSSCQPNDVLNDGFTGTLTISGNQMSVCLTATPTTPHPILHTLQLWSPTITAQ